MKRLLTAAVLVMWAALAAAAQDGTISGGYPDRLQRGGARVRANSDGSVTVTLASGKAIQLECQAALPATGAEGQFACKTGEGAHTYTGGAWVRLGAAVAHTHALADIADEGTAAALNVAASGDAAAGQVVKGNDSRLSDARTPTAHAHAGADITSGTVAPARLGGGTPSVSNFLRGDGTWAAPSGGATANATTGAIPYLSAANTFSDSVLTQSGGNVTLGGNLLASSDGARNIGAQAANRPYVYAYGLSVGGVGAGPGEIRFLDSTGAVRFTNGLVDFGSNTQLRVSPGSPYVNAPDIGLKRLEAGAWAVTNGQSGGGTLKIGDPGAQPTCNSTRRGMFWIDEGGAGVADSVAVCAKDAGDAYAWRVIF